MGHTASPFHGDGTESARVASHLQGAKENYELSLVAEEAQRHKAQKAVEVMTETYAHTTEAVRFGHEVHRGQVAQVKRQTNDKNVRDQTIDEMAEVRDIYHNFLSDNLEAQGRLLVNIAKSDPTAQRQESYEEIIELTPRERIKGVAKRTRR